MTDEREEKAARVPAEGEPLRKSVIAARLRARVREAPPGVLAELRRAGSTEVCGAFYRIALDLIDPHGKLTDEAEGRWLTYVGLLARVPTLTDGPPLGAALSAAGVSEGRLLHLLQGHGPGLADAARGVVHQLASKAAPFDAVQLANLLLSDGASDEDAVRRRIARDFYRHDSASR